MTIETRELVISEELKKKVDMICRFACVKYVLFNGSIINIKNTNIAYTKPHILKVNGNDYLILEECEEVFINGYNERIKFKDLGEYLKAN
ncbi:MAG: hypothetical protein J6D28_01560 [Bacilli bacterium]|nr:hypothetical protein [Bacilli bacterium]